MVVKASGSMSQVKVDPDKPYTFAVYGQGKPIEITEKLSIRLEAPNAPAYVTEILPHQWRCTVPAFENLSKIYAMAEKSVGLMLYKNIRVSFAESCTGGLLSEIITSVPGASSVFEAGFCTYSERIKMKILSVPESVISETTVVSEETALYMARGMKDISSSE